MMEFTSYTTRCVLVIPGLGVGFACLESLIKAETLDERESLFFPGEDIEVGSPD